MMPLTKKQQIRGVRILLTVFYGFLLSSILFHYIIHGIVETIRRPTNPFAIIMIILGVLILISIGLSIYATWFDNTTIMLVSGVVLICVFILTIVFGIVRIIRKTSHRGITATTVASVLMNADDLSDGSKEKLMRNPPHESDTYVIVEDTIVLIIELVSILFAILGTFILYRYVQGKYNSVPTTEPTTEPKTP